MSFYDFANGGGERRCDVQIRVTIPQELTESGAGGHLTLRVPPHSKVSYVCKQIINRVNQKRRSTPTGKGQMPNLSKFGLINLESKNDTLLDENMPLSLAGDDEQTKYELKLVSKKDRVTVKFKEGWLWKRRKNSPDWCQRYFIVKDGELVYKKKKTDITNHGKIELKGAKTIRWPPVNIYGRRYLFGVTPLKTNRTYLIAADSDQDRKRWLDVFSQQGAQFCGQLKTALKYKSSIKEGYLQYLNKSGKKSMLKKFRKYFVCLMPNRLTVLTKRDSKNPAFHLTLSKNDKILVPVESFTEFYIIVRKKDSHEKHQFKAGDPEDRAAWMTAFSGCCGMKLKSTHQHHTKSEKEQGEIELKLLTEDDGKDDEDTPPVSNMFTTGNAQAPAGGFDEDEFEYEEDYSDWPDGLQPWPLQDDLEDIMEEGAMGFYSDMRQEEKFGGHSLCMSYAEGPGLDPNESNEEAKQDEFQWFIIYAKDRNGDTIKGATCEVEMFGPDDNEINVNVRDIYDGSFFVSYPFPLDPGEYEIRAQLPSPATAVKNFPLVFTVPETLSPIGGDGDEGDGFEHGPMTPSGSRTGGEDSQSEGEM